MEKAEPGLFSGEYVSENLSRPVARHANGCVTAPNGENTVINLGELGEHRIYDVRFRDSAKEGFVTAYIRAREIVSENKTATTLTASTIAIGAVLTGIYALKHHKK